MRNESVLIIGGGNVGRGMAFALQHRHPTPVVLWTRNHSRKLLADALAQSKLVLVCVSDKAIAEVGKLVTQCATARADTIVAHTSGALAASELGSMANCICASVHPLVACPTPELAAERLRGASYAVECENPKTEQWLADWLRKELGGAVYRVAPGQKAHYHAACVMASNLMVGLLDIAMNEARAAGFAPLGNSEDSDGRRAFCDLAAGAVAAVRELGTVKGLTGPIARGDWETVQRHRACLSGESLEIYDLLSRQCEQLAKERKK